MTRKDNRRQTALFIAFRQPISQPSQLLFIIVTFLHEKPLDVTVSTAVVSRSPSYAMCN